MLNGLWLGFFIVAALASAARWFAGDPAVFAAMVESLFAMARLLALSRRLFVEEHHTRGGHPSAAPSLHWDYPALFAHS